VRAASILALFAWRRRWFIHATLLETTMYVVDLERAFAPFLEPARIVFDEVHQFAPGDLAVLRYYSAISVTRPSVLVFGSVS
jgi:hypothetical protein